MDESHAGSLLIASPGMGDWFRRSVVIVVEHTDQGAFGLVLNRPSAATLGEAAPALGELIGPDHLIYAGGPVGPEAFTAIAEHADPEQSTKLVTGDLGMVDLDSPPPGLRRMRVFVGYAGWGAGQLEGEISEDAWILEPALPDDPFSEGDLWAQVLARKGGEYALLSRMPPDPSLN